MLELIKEIIYALVKGISIFFSLISIYVAISEYILAAYELKSEAKIYYVLNFKLARWICKFIKSSCINEDAKFSRSLCNDLPSISLANYRYISRLP